jgi:replicative DNA helicase
MSRVLQLVPDSRDRTPPWDEDAEQAVLGGCLIDESATVRAAAVLRPEHFYREAHRRIFEAAAAISERREPVDPLTMAAQLGVHFSDCGGMDYMAELLDVVPTAANIEYHARLVLDCARRRQLIHAGTEIVRNAHEPGGLPVDTLVQRAEQLVSECAGTAAGDVAMAKHEVMGVFERLERLTANPGSLAGLSWGYPAVDDATGGLHPGDLVIVAARPSMGKTAFVTGAGLHAAIAGQTPVALFSLEMSRSQVVERMLCHEALVNIGLFRRGQLNDDDFARLAQAAGHINVAPLFIDDTGSLSLAEMRGKLRRLQQTQEQSGQPPLGLVIVDYIQLMEHTGRENRTQEVSAISRGLKRLAREFEVPVIALSQLSRAVEQRANKRPQLSDLRESGAIEQDADLVGFLYREEYYLEDDAARQQNKAGAAEFIIGKQRNGPTGAVDLYFRKECARFESMAVGSWGNK